jgi:hypothetical protein
MTKRAGKHTSDKKNLQGDEINYTRDETIFTRKIATITRETKSGTCETKSCSREIKSIYVFLNKKTRSVKSVSREFFLSPVCFPRQNTSPKTIQTSKIINIQ